MGKLIPIGCVEALPGDTVQHHTNVLIRVSPLAAPVMHSVTARVHHFFVPNRLVWDGWEDFITGGDDGDDASTIPTAAITGSVANRSNAIPDYLGVPVGVSTTQVVNALPIRAYNMIFNEFYRDQDLVTEVLESNRDIQNIAWEKDYFTSARPWTQKGADVTLPLGDQAPITGIGLGVSASNAFGGVARETDGTSPTYADAFASNSAGADAFVRVEEDPTNAGYPNIYADLSSATGGNINDIRRAFAIQRYQEARARYGSRYTEYLRYLGVNPKDSRLQRPEYLGGGHTQLNFSEVLQTGPETRSGSEEYGVGDLYGHGIAAMRSNKYRRFIEEHGHIITMLSVRPKSIYANGVKRMWHRTDKEDFFQKELQHIGQQEILNKELYSEAPSPTDTFGYQDRYMEYREEPSYVSAEYRTLLNYWHMAREFTAQPVLNQSFTDCVPTKRIHNEQTQHALWVMCQHKMVARRIVDRSATPRIF